MPTKKQTRKQYGRRASGKTQTTISLSQEMLEKAKRKAEADGRSISNYIEQLLKSLPVLIVLAFLAFHVTRSPKRWNAEALAATGKAAVQKIQLALK